jgi:arylsulfatase A-like enzyme
VVLVTLDTTRADRLGCYGNPRVRTPHLDRLASEATLFEQAFTPIPSTLPSHASILTGTSPARHGLHDNAVYALEADATTLAGVLRGAGFATGAFVSAFVLDRQFGLAQGFDV